MIKLFSVKVSFCNIAPGINVKSISTRTLSVFSVLVVMGFVPLSLLSLFFLFGFFSSLVFKSFPTCLTFFSFLCFMVVLFPFKKSLGNKIGKNSTDCYFSACTIHLVHHLSNRSDSIPSLCFSFLIAGEAKERS